MPRRPAGTRSALDDQGWPRTDDLIPFLLVDVEGAEPAVLRSIDLSRGGRPGRWSSRPPSPNRHLLDPRPVGDGVSSPPAYSGSARVDGLSRYYVAARGPRPAAEAALELPGLRAHDHYLTDSHDRALRGGRRTSTGCSSRRRTGVPRPSPSGRRSSGRSGSRPPEERATGWPGARGDRAHGVRRVTRRAARRSGADGWPGRRRRQGHPRNHRWTLTRRPPSVALDQRFREAATCRRPDARSSAADRHPGAVASACCRSLVERCQGRGRTDAQWPAAHRGVRGLPHHGAAAGVRSPAGAPSPATGRRPDCSPTCSPTPAAAAWTSPCRWSPAARWSRSTTPRATTPTPASTGWSGDRPLGGASGTARRRWPGSTSTRPSAPCRSAEETRIFPYGPRSPRRRTRTTCERHPSRAVAQHGRARRCAPHRGRTSGRPGPPLRQHPLPHRVRHDPDHQRRHPPVLRFRRPSGSTCRW